MGIERSPKTKEAGYHLRNRTVLSDQRGTTSSTGAIPKLKALKKTTQLAQKERWRWTPTTTEGDLSQVCMIHQRDKVGENFFHLFQLLRVRLSKILSPKAQEAYNLPVRPVTFYRTYYYFLPNLSKSIYK